MEDKKGIWQGGTTNTKPQMSEKEARFWRGFEDYNDNVGLESDFEAEYIVEKEMRERTPVSGMGGRGGPVDAVRSANQKTNKENNSKPEVSK